MQRQKYEYRIKSVSAETVIGVGLPNPYTDLEGPDDAPDGHPDGFTIRGGNSTRLSIKNIGGILLGIRNDTEREISGDI